MNKIRFIAIFTWIVSLLLIVVSCDQESFEATDGLQTEIRLSSGIQVQSRATFPGTDKQISAGGEVAVWIDQIGTEISQLYGRNTLIADGNGGLSGEHKMFFPLNGNHINIYALHTNAGWYGDAYPTTTMTHTVDADQRTLPGYVASDLLYGRAMDVARTANAVPLTFYHLLSKIQVAIRPAEGLTASDIQSVFIGGIKRLANVTLDKASAPNAITVTAGGTVSSVQVGTDVSLDFTEANVRYNDAIVVPQSVAEGTVFITVNLKSGESLVYRLSSNAVFESGKKYTCHMTVSLTEITLSTSVSDWKPGDLITGNNGIIRYVVNYTDNTSETVYSETMGTVEFSGAGKTVRSLDLPDLGKSYLIGRSDLTSLTLNLDAGGNLRFRSSVGGYTPIGSYAEFQLINTVPGALAGSYKQEADIDLMSEEWMPIGSATAKFTGKYDGAGYNIARLQIDKSSSSYIALFGYIDGSYAEIGDVHITSGNIVGGDYTAGICGYLFGATIKACSNAALVTSKGVSSSKSIYGGGIVGRNDHGTVSACYNIGSTITTSSYCSTYSGGIVGYNESGTITACYNTNTTSSTTSTGSYSPYAGGVAGFNKGGTITACFNTGNISSLSSSYYDCCGGIVAYNDGGFITACYNIGTVTRATFFGGVVGCQGYGGTTAACYWKLGIGMPTVGIGDKDGISVDVTSFTTHFTPDVATYPEWEIGTGETNGWWKNYNGNNNLPQLWWE